MDHYYFVVVPTFTFFEIFHEEIIPGDIVCLLAHVLIDFPARGKVVSYRPVDYL